MLKQDPLGVTPLKISLPTGLTVFSSGKVDRWLAANRFNTAMPVESPGLQIDHILLSSYYSQSPPMGIAQSSDPLEVKIIAVHHHAFIGASFLVPHVSSSLFLSVGKESFTSLIFNQAQLHHILESMPV